MYQSSVRTLTFFLHSDGATLLQAASLTLPSHPHVHLAVSAVLADIVGCACDAAPEETCKNQCRKDQLRVGASLISNEHDKQQREALYCSAVSTTQRQTTYSSDLVHARTTQHIHTH